MSVDGVSVSVFILFIHIQQYAVVCHIAALHGWVSIPYSIRRDILCDNATCAYQRIGADGMPGYNSGIGTDGCSFLNDCPGKAFRVLLGAGNNVIGKCDIGADEYIVLYGHSIPELNSGFDSDPVPDNYIVLNEHVGAEVAIGSDAGTSQNNTELPDVGAGTNLLSLYIC